MSATHVIDPIPRRIAIFDDSSTAVDHYNNNLFPKPSFSLEFFVRPNLTEEEWQKLAEFQPELIIVDLVMGSSRRDGLSVLQHLHEDTRFQGTSIVVCSKLVNDTIAGQEEKERSQRMPNVKAALPKYPDSAEAFLPYINSSR